ncbi:MAG: hypothetical protein ACXADY_09750 [Candidatus Hodarchaeales archaeon]
MLVINDTADSKTYVSYYGGFFSCPQCQNTPNREYIASINIYCVYKEQNQKHFHLKLVRTMPYMGAGIPRNCPRGASVQIS